MQDRLRAVKAFVAGVHGVLHNNQDILLEVNGKLVKGFARSHYDGQGISLLRAIGIRVCLVSTEPAHTSHPLVQMIERWNGLPSSSRMEGDGGWSHVKLISDVVGTDQVAPVEEWLKRWGLSFADCAVMGHDLVQVPLMKAAMFRVVPVDAEDVARRIADYVTTRPGGNGALRDFVNLVIEARNIDSTTLPTR